MNTLGLGKFLLIIVIILLAIWYFSPQTFDFLKTKTVNLVTPDNENANKITDTLNNLSFIQTNESSEQEEEEVEEVVSFNPCTLPNKGYPDYEGTSREGDTCADVPLNKDYECIANPPKNFVGSVYVVDKISVPMMYCCVSDGYCKWG